MYFFSSRFASVIGTSYPGSIDSRSLYNSLRPSSKKVMMFVCVESCPGGGLVFFEVVQMTGVNFRVFSLVTQHV